MQHRDRDSGSLRTESPHLYCSLLCRHGVMRAFTCYLLKKEKERKTNDRSSRVCCCMKARSCMNNLHGNYGFQGNEVALSFSTKKNLEGSSLLYI